MVQQNTPSFADSEATNLVDLLWFVLTVNIKAIFMFHAPLYGFASFHLLTRTGRGISSSQLFCNSDITET